jgi:hypothetical protein
MKLEIDGFQTRVTLSRRNLKTLLAKLDGFPKDSACVITKTDDGDHYLIVRAEEDEVHYGKRGYGPGPMHPTTERRIESAFAIKVKKMKK